MRYTSTCSYISCYFAVVYVSNYRGIVMQSEVPLGLLQSYLGTYLDIATILHVTGHFQSLAKTKTGR